MDYETIQIIAKEKCDYIIWKLSETRPEEIVIIAMLAISIGIGIAILVQLKKLKDRL